MTEKKTESIELNGKEYASIEIVDQEHDDKLIAKITFDTALVKNGYAIRLTK
ncbi:hypothetical protein LASUN_13460 [Lentilactobacillus sunkii]|uniref:Uncharacterized protein n=2 Tax=Lentilactobacillus sunkii TaxID=481719 RepID=A0A1E7XCE4_9LACO|nr:hypothetical protein LASUN_13460 [Lentilactobacillus sunkii]